MPCRSVSGRILLAVLAVFAISTWMGALPALAQDQEPEPFLNTLKGFPVPEPPNLSDFIQDREKAIALGKAFFWDMQLGSDGIQACASCHFNAGADSREINQLNPGSLSLGGTTFELHGPNATLVAGDFPFHQLADPKDRNSAVLFDVDDVVSSQGVVRGDFTAIVLGRATDRGKLVADPVFNVGGILTRRVEPRNAPTVINAVFNLRNFFDGRAQFEFNGVTPFGTRDPNAWVGYARSRSNGDIIRVAIPSASLASQAVGPPLSFFEMSLRGRSFPELGRKMLSLRPLGLQMVHTEDSVLGSLSRGSNPGLKPSYESLIMQAFKRVWWDSFQVVRVPSSGRPVFETRPSRLRSDQYTLMEFNFALLFGLAVQLYEATLVSDDTPFDRHSAGDMDSLTPQQLQGLELFVGKARCVQCHDDAPLTDAARGGEQLVEVENMIMGDGELAHYDRGFYNIGVRPTAEDLGIGGLDPFGNPLSRSRRIQLGQESDGVHTIGLNDRVAVDGAFKVPGLRNVELTAPYFHNGGMATLRQVVDFYNRGGDFHELNIDDLDPEITNLDLTEEEIDALIAFLLALTDERVRTRSAPFDNPQLFVPNGHIGDDMAVMSANGVAIDRLVEIPATGRNGGAPLPKFLE